MGRYREMIEQTAFRQEAERLLQQLRRLPTLEPAGQPGPESATADAPALHPQSPAAHLRGERLLALLAIDAAPWEVRRELAQAVGESEAGNLLDVLEQLATADPEWRVRDAAAQALARGVMPAAIAVL